MNQNDEQSKRLKQLRYRANHRGIKEMDIVLGGFVDRHINALEEEELMHLEKLMEQNDRDLLQWVTGEKPVPDEFDTPLFSRILQVAKSGVLAGGAENKK